jgi:hypothetical protein
MITWNEYVKIERVRINKKRKRSKLEPLSYKECLKMCSQTWGAEKERLLKKQARADKKNAKTE